MKPPADIPASVLPVVIVVSVIMALIVLGLLSLWDTNYLFFSRTDHIRQQRAHIDSFYTLYCTHPEIMESLDADSTILLYDDIPDSRLKVSAEPWGLYESVCAGSVCGKVRVSRLVGLAAEDERGTVLWYRNHGTSLTVTGKTEIIGNSALPSGGLIYGQLRSVFFSGGTVPVSSISTSDEEIPCGDGDSLKIIEEIFDRRTENPVSDGETYKWDFANGESLCLTTADSVLYDCSLAGKIVLTGDRLTLDSTCRISDIIVAANYIRIGDGFKGSLQAFARDSIVVGEGAILDFPSGIYSRGSIRIGAGSVVNGYVINNIEGEKDILKANTVKEKTSKVRGLYYCDGISQIQGIVTGSAYIDEAVYYSAEGYYRHLIYDAAFIANGDIPHPLWTSREGKRKIAAWVN